MNFAMWRKALNDPEVSSGMGSSGVIGWLISAGSRPHHDLYFRGARRAFCLA
jgi:hypothetical protein